MKIGFFTDSYFPSIDGVATSVESSAKGLRELGHEVYIVAPGHPHLKDEKDIFRLTSVRIMKTPEVWLGLEVPSPSMLKIAGLSVDIVHGHSGGPVSFLGWQVARLHHVPFVETYHTLWKHYRHYFPYPRFLKMWMIKKITAVIGNDCDGVIAPSEKAKRDLLYDGVRKPIYVVPSGIDLAKFHYGMKDFFYKTYHIDSSKKILFTAGRLAKEKSIDFLVKAFAVVRRLSPDTVFVIAGEGRDKERLKILAEREGLSECVYFVGNIAHKDMPKAYAGASVFVFASRTETQGMVITEALASGLPVVAVEDSAFENIISDGVNGYLVKKEAEIFAQKVKHIIHDTDLRMRFSHNARKSSQQFSTYSVAKGLGEVYSEIIIRKRSDK